MFYVDVDILSLRLGKVDQMTFETFWNPTEGSDWGGWEIIIFTFPTNRDPKYTCYDICKLNPNISVFLNLSVSKWLVGLWKSWRENSTIFNSANFPHF